MHAIQPTNHAIQPTNKPWLTRHSCATMFRCVRRICCTTKQAVKQASTRANKQSVVVPTVFATSVLVCGSVAQLFLVASQVTNVAKVDNDEQVQNESRVSRVSRVLELVHAALCWSTDLVFVAINSKPSQYEYELSGLTKTPCSFETIQSFKERWYECKLSAGFLNNLDFLLACPPGSTTRRCDQPEKYMSYFAACVDWELVHVQPMRFVVNRTNSNVLLAVPVAVCLGANALALLAEHCAWVTHGMNLLRHSKIPSWFVWIITLDLAVKFGTYKQCLPRH